MSKRRRTTVVLMALAGLLLAGYLAAVWPSLTREPVGPPRDGLPEKVEGGQRSFSGRFVGHPEATIVERFGPPTDRWHGHVGLPPLDERRTYPDAVTATYERPAGTLYLSYCKERGRLICFRSEWVPRVGCSELRYRECRAARRGDHPPLAARQAEPTAAIDRAFDGG